MKGSIVTDAGALLTRHKLSAGEYHRMADAGVLGEDARVELIDGDVAAAPDIAMAVSALLG